MRRSSVTLSEVARTLNLSTCTVSKILNRSFNGISYSKETIRRVEEGAKTMGYTANAQARSLRTRKTMLVGFLLPSAQVSLFGALTDELELKLRERGYQVLIVHSRNDFEAEPALVSSLLARGIDGLIWIPGRDRVRPSEVGLKPGFPALILDRPSCTKKLPFVATENRAAARELARRMHEAGHRRVGVLNAPEGDRSMAERFEGIRDIFPDSTRVIDLPNEAASAKAALPGLLEGGERPSAVVALSESLAIGAITGLRDLGLSIPGEISFASFDDFPLAGHWSPRITVVRQDVSRLAGESVDLLLEMLGSSGQSQSSREIRVPAILEWRDSVASVAAGPRG